jgi:tetratricopeptide (TPR) repeat protein
MGSHTFENHAELISSYPKLAAWFNAHHAKPPSIENLADFHMWGLAKAMRLSGILRFRQWSGIITDVVNASSSFLEHTLDTDTLATSLGTSLTDIYAALAEDAIIQGLGSEALSSLKCLADNTNLAAFRFLAAWAAFNLHKLDECIAECEKVNEPFAPIHTLLGQALLESGQPGEALDALKIAIELNPSDPLPLVQIIKAYLVSGIQIEAMRAVDRCRKLLGTHIEIECLAAMTIMAGQSRTKEFCDRTLNQFASHLTNEPGDVEAFSIAMELATELVDKDWAMRFLGLAEFSSSTNPINLAGKISKLLKKTGELHWHDLSRLIIDKTLIVTKAPYIGDLTQ